ncbi:hypothetical protein [Salinicoccus halodurans]|uniref:hypothetical protein n=1 Tax=Salinicoccus halodurans TaxID=407035 RepID=UPI000AD8AE07|nr:hypothetical protein [Salinicoccus halodurans]
MYDMNAEVQLWTKAGHLKINLGKKVDVRTFDGLIAQAVAGVEKFFITQYLQFLK